MAKLNWLKNTRYAHVRSRCACVFIAVSMSLGILRTTKIPLYKLEYVNLDEG
jgi:hypothetical protein